GSIPRSRKPRRADSSHASRAPLLMRLMTLERSVKRGVRLWKVTSSKPSWSFFSANNPMRGSPIVPVPTMCRTFLLDMSSISRQRPGGGFAEPPETIPSRPGPDQRGNGPIATCGEALCPLPSLRDRNAPPPQRTRADRHHRPVGLGEDAGAAGLRGPGLLLRGQPAGHPHPGLRGAGGADPPAAV